MEGSIIGFFDESAPQTTANTIRVWSFRKPVIIKDTSKYRANTFGFYSLNGRSVVDFQDHSRKENIIFYYERSFLIVLHNVWSTGPGKATDLFYEFRTRQKGWWLTDRHHALARGRIVECLPATCFPELP